MNPEKIEVNEIQCAMKILDKCEKTKKFKSRPVLKNIIRCEQSRGKLKVEE